MNYNIDSLECDDPATGLLVRGSSGLPLVTVMTVFDVFRERRRQIIDLRYGARRDDQYIYGELAQAAMALAHSSFAGPEAEGEDVESWWPFDTPMKREGPRKDLVRAAALLLAEIERLDRAPVLQVPP